MKKKYFGTDGIRGTYNKFPMISSFMFELTKSIKKTHKEIKKVLIGKDTRESSDQIELDISNGFERVNVDCYSCGIVSTPILSFNTKKFKYDLGIMISASHNPYQDNGIKIFDSNGEKLSDKNELMIERNIILNNKNNYSKNLIKKIDKLYYPQYENQLLKIFSNIKNFDKKIFLDCANGSLSFIAPEIFKKLNFNFLSFANKPNGKNINKNCGATFPIELSKNTLKNNAKIGIAFDGDADRVIFCDEFGRIIDGDHILAALAIFLKRKNKLKNNLIVTTKMSNLGFRKFLIQNHIKFFLSDVGDRYVVEKMREHNCNLGGEQSGHIIFSENSFSGDGIFTALLIIQILFENDINISELCGNLFEKVPQQLVNLKLNRNPAEIINNKIIKRLEKETIKSVGCDILLRKSGTENLLRLMVQASSTDLVKKVIEEFIFEIKKLDEK